MLAAASCMSRDRSGVRRAKRDQLNFADGLIRSESCRIPRLIALL